MEKSTMTIRRNWLHHITIFLFNVREDFIEEAWKDDPHLVGHLEKKLNGIRIALKNPNSNSPYAIARFMAELDLENQQILQHYIEENTETYN